MKAVILAGGYGTRLSEETGVKPKPMVAIGEEPILWHILKIFSAYDVEDFIICCGYKSEVIKQYFSTYYIRKADVTFEPALGLITVHSNDSEPWRVTLVETGTNTMTGGRLRRVREYLGDETFFFTYGDGISDVNLHELLAFHRSAGVMATLTAVQPPGRFGTFSLAHGQTKIGDFREKPSGDGAWVNGGFFVLEPDVIDLIEGDETVWEREPLEALAHRGQLAAYRHSGFWQPMDTLRDRVVLDQMWTAGAAPWKVW